MAVAIIALSIISIFAVGLAVLVFQPATFELAYEAPFWDEDNTVHSDLIIARSTLYDASIAIPVIAISGIALWAYLSVNRRDDL